MLRYAAAPALALVLLLGPRAAAAAPAAPATVRAGDLFIACAGGGPSGRLIFDGNSYPSFPKAGSKEICFLLGVDLEAAPGDYPLVVDGGEGRRRPAGSVKVVPGSFPEERLTLPPKMVTPPADVLERIAREREAAAAVYRTSSGQRRWEPPFTRPCDGTPSGNFGRRRILNGIPKSPHSGEDYAAAAGDAVRAVAAGDVRMARDLYYSGNTILIDHGGGLVSQYFHLSRLLVGEGDRVERGQKIGEVGATGRVTGPHLHFGLRFYGQRVDSSQLWSVFRQK